MEFPAQLREEIERLLSGENSGQLTAAAEGLSRRYRENSGSGKSLAGSRRDILAYTAVRMPATFGAAAKALGLSLERFRGEIRTVLDVGAGTGAASHAAYVLTDCSEIVCIEREPEMISVGRQLTECCGVPASWKRGDITSDFADSAELVICSYCLNELTASARKAAVRRLWDSTEKLLLIVEPGTPEGYANILAAREQLVSMGAFIAAPCPHSGECPLDKDDWCHFTARVARSRLHKQLKGGVVPYEDEKFCFIAASREPVEPCTARILRHPRTDSGRITLRLCTANGVEERMITKKNPQFKAARKSGAGDSFN